MTRGEDADLLRRSAAEYLGEPPAEVEFVSRFTNDAKAFTLGWFLPHRSRRRFLILCIEDSSSRRLIGGHVSEGLSRLTSASEGVSYFVATNLGQDYWVVCGTCPPGIAAVELEHRATALRTATAADMFILGGELGGTVGDLALVAASGRIASAVALPDRFRRLMTRLARQDGSSA